MSGNRANASAVNRRVNTQGQPKVTPATRGTGTRGQPNTGRPVQQSRGSGRTMQQEEPAKNVKISISDAIGLVTLRLGRVETMLSSMPNPGELAGANASNSGNENENYRVVDEAVFTSIVTRLDKLETGLNDGTNNQTMELDEKLSNLEKIYNELKTEITVTKELVMTVQN